MGFWFLKCLFSSLQLRKPDAICQRCLGHNLHISPPEKTTLLEASPGAERVLASEVIGSCPTSIVSISFSVGLMKKLSHHFSSNDNPPFYVYLSVCLCHSCISCMMTPDFPTFSCTSGICMEPSPSAFPRHPRGPQQNFNDSFLPAGFSAQHLEGDMMNR